MFLAQTNFRSSVAEIFNFLTFSRELLVPLVHCCPRQIHKGTIKTEAIKVPRQVMSWERLSSCAMSSMREKQHWGKEGATEPEPPQPICLRCNFREAGTKYSCIFFHAAPQEKKSTFKGSSPLKKTTGKCQCQFVHSRGWMGLSESRRRQNPQKETFHIHKIRAN